MNLMVHESTNHVFERHRRRGVAAVLTVILLVVLFGFASLTLDVGQMYSVAAESQNAADAAALAGVSALREGHSEWVNDRALDYLARNLKTEPISAMVPLVELGRWDLEAATFTTLPPEHARRANAVRVKVTRNDMPLIFAHIFGKSTFAVSRESVASVGATACKLWARDKIVFEDHSTSDSYDLTSGPYVPGSGGPAGDLCGCKDIELKDETVIDGDVLYTRELKKSAGTDVTGEIGILPECLDPALLDDGAAIDNELIGTTDNGNNPWAAFADNVEDSDTYLPENNDNELIPFTSDGFPGFNPAKKELKVKDGDSITFPPGTFYFSKLDVNKFTINLSGPTTIYIEHQFDMHEGGIVNPSQDPLDLKIIVAGKKFHLKKTADFHGYVYAPNAKVTIDDHVDFFGAVMAKEVKFKKYSNFHADQSLPGTEIAEVALLVR